MTISKFKTFEAAEKDLWCFQPDHNYYLKIRKLFEIAAQLNPIGFPRGIFKYKTLEQAEKAKESWVRQWALNKGQDRVEEKKVQRHKGKALRH